MRQHVYVLPSALRIHPAATLTFDTAPCPSSCRDLKRDVQRKLQRLDKRTQRAVISLLQQRVLADATGNGKQTGEELADAVDTRVREEQMALDDDE
eukprot:SAG31_NODE_402_length_16197_cov_5.262425_7_plen_96_part_00